MNQSDKPSPEPGHTGGGTELRVAKIGLISALVVGLFGLIGAGINAYSSRAGVLIPMRATQTAEARLPTALQVTLAPSPTIPEPTTTIPAPTEEPTAVPAPPTEEE